jgi:hypothetical protein
MLSLQSVEAFKTWYANRKMRVRDAAGNLKSKPLGAAWLEHPKRRQYEGVDLVPNEPNELPNGKLNLWRGYGVAPQKGRWSLMARHIRDALANGDPKAAEYIFRWIAWSFQHPGELAEVALENSMDIFDPVFFFLPMKLFGLATKRVKACSKA